MNPPCRPIILSLPHTKSPSPVKSPPENGCGDVNPSGSFWIRGTSILLDPSGPFIIPSGTFWNPSGLFGSQLGCHSWLLRQKNVNIFVNSHEFTYGLAGVCLVSDLTRIKSFTARFTLNFVFTTRSKNHGVDTLRFVAKVAGCRVITRPRPCFIYARVVSGIATGRLADRNHYRERHSSPPSAAVLQCRSSQHGVLPQASRWRRRGGPALIPERAWC